MNHRGSGSAGPAGHPHGNHPMTSPSASPGCGATDLRIHVDDQLSDSESDLEVDSPSPLSPESETSHHSNSVSPTMHHPSVVTSLPLNLQMHHHPRWARTQIVEWKRRMLIKMMDEWWRDLRNDRFQGNRLRAIGCHSWASRGGHMTKKLESDRGYKKNNK